ncbi:MAG: hypothetical protein NC177_12405 [Ruminococcus flavefaciens]|nr:hypothetical protein [Ruminococcus flavefaciens]
MKLDLLVYGRGQERLDGYQLFAAPEYWSDDMLIAMGAFNDLWTQGDLSNIETKAFALESNPWGRTYMFVHMNEPYCCAFLRCTRVEGDTPGTWLKEARNFDIWSMEGVCCPFEKRGQFFAMLPSVILWFEQDNTSLYKRLKEGKIGTTIEIPDNMIYNPYTYSNTPPPAELLNIIKNEKTRNKWLDLCDMINSATRPSHFIFGSLAGHFAERIGSDYGVEYVFSTTDDKKAEIPADWLNKMEVIKQKEVDRQSVKAELYLSFRENKDGEQERKWKIIDTSSEEKKIIIESERRLVYDYNFDLKKLKAEAEAVRDFAQSIHWGVTETPEAKERYTFRLEE